MPAPGELIMVEPKRPKPPKHWSDWTVEERKAQVIELGLPGFRADQFSRQWYQRLNNDTASWTDVPADMREAVKDLLFPDLMTSIRELKCDNGTTVKQVWKLFDGVLVESVLMRYTDRTTMCISSQAGCGMNCPFCATGQSGLTRNLSTAEIVEQVLAGARSLANGEIEGGIGRVNNLVFMGMGEPMANYDNLLRAIGILNAPWGVGLGARHMTVSTSGLVPQILKLASQPLQVRLAISFHGATDEVRNTIMPVNKKYPVEELVAACEDYVRIKKQRITFEYILIRDVNDSLEQARLLAKQARRVGAKVNLIPYNVVDGLPWIRPEEDSQDAFLAVLRQAGAEATLRREKGHDIAAACGQLRLQVEKSVAEKPILN